jgi:hypothetical protein
MPQPTWLDHTPKRRRSGTEIVPEGLMYPGGGLVAWGSR